MDLLRPGRRSTPLVVALTTGIAYAAAAEASWRWFGAGSAGLAFFPAAGVSFAALVMTRRTTWPLIVVAIGAAEVLVDLAHGLSLRRSLGWALANCVEPLAGAVAVQIATARQRPADGPARRIDLRDRLGFGWFVAGGVLAGPAVGSLIGATIRTTTTGGWWENAGHWIAGDGLGVLAVGAPIVVALDGRRGRIRYGELALVTGLTVAVGVVSFSWTAPPVYAVLPLLVWAATRLGVDGVALTGFVFCVMANDATASDSGPFARLDWFSPQARIGLTQLFLAVSLLTGWFLAVEVASRLAAVARSEAERAARRAAEAAHSAVQHDAHGQELLARISEVVASSADGGDPRALLRSLAAAAVPTFVDVCSFRLLEDGRLTTASIATDDADLLAELEPAVAVPLDPDGDSPVAAAFRSGSTVLAHIANDTEIDEAFDDPEHRLALRRNRLATLLCVPLPPGRETSGVVTFARRARLEPIDRPMAEEFVRRCAAFVDEVLLRERATVSRRDAEQAAARAELVATVTETLSHAQDADQVRGALASVMPSALGAGDVDLVLDTAARPAPAPHVVSLPLEGVDHQPLGWLVVTWPGERPHDDATALLLETIADIAAQAIERSAARRQEVRQRRRSEAFATLAAELSAAATIDQVLHVAGNCSLALFDAAACAVLRRVDRHGALRLLFARGLAPDQLREWSSLDLDAPSAPARAARHSSLVVEEAGNVRRSVLGAVPIEVGGAALGALVVELRHGHDLDQADRRLLLSVAAVVSQAAERAAGFETLTARRAFAERAQRANATLAAASGTGEVLSALFGCVLELLDADEAVLLLDHGSPLRTWWRTSAGDMHLDEATPLPSHVERWVHALDSPASRVADVMEATVLRAQRRVDPAVRGPSVAPATALAAIPLRLGPGRAIGTMCVVFGQHRRLDDSLDETCRALEDQWSDALRRARAFDLELAAIARLQVLQRITAALGAARTTDDVVHVIEASAVQLGVRGARVEIVGDIDAERPPSAGAAEPAAGSSDAVVLPLVTRQGDLGSLVLQLGAEDELPHRSLLETVADLCAQALDRTRSSDFEHDVAVELQRAMLGRPDDVQRFEVGSSYRPSVNALDVGGDWYDVIRLGNDDAVLVVGDVVGHSLDAAAAMGQLRSAARALAPIVADPAELLMRLDGFVEGVPDALYTTMCAITIGAGGGFRYASAGHPPPIVLHADGSSDVLDGGRSAPLGLAAGSRPSDGAGLRADDLVVLYTDGLIERRDATLDQGIEHLRTTLAALRHLPATDLADGIVDAMLAGSEQGDDIAVLVAKLVSTSFRYELDGDRRHLRAMRARLRTWLGAYETDEAAVDELLLGVNEAAANAMEHAEPGVNDAAAIVVSARVEHGRILAEVVDRGTWRNAAPTSGRGRGLAVIGAVSDDLHVDRRRDGTTVRITKELRHPVIARSS